MNPLSFSFNDMERETSFRAIVELLPQITWTIDDNGQADYFNRRWFDYTGLDFEQTKGYGWQQVVHPDDLDNALMACQDIRASGIASDIELRYERADGVYRWHLTRLQPVNDGEGNISYWIGTSTDIEELKQLQQQKDDFISIASHELKTPLTSLSGSLQMLQKAIHINPSSEKVPAYANRASRSLSKLVRLLEDMVNITRVRYDQEKINKKWTNLTDLIGECCEQERLAGTHTIMTSGNKDLAVYADPQRIDQVIVNLVNNAIKYSPKSNRIEINVSHHEGMAKVSVTDYGIGIRSEKIPHLFERYYRADPSMIEFSGFGLGLYICAEIIKRHGGEIGVDSQVGEGSTFWFTLPING